jgi:Putative beta-barrel porin 2
MNLSTRLVPQPSAEVRGLILAVAAGERPPLHFVRLMVPRIRKLGLTALVTATLCSPTSHLVAAEPSVEVYTQDSVVTSEGSGTTSLLAYVPKFSFTVGGGYDDNVNAGNGGARSATTTGSAGSAFTQTHMVLSKDLRAARTQIKIKLGGSVVYYFDRPGRSTDVTGTLDVNLRHSVSERLTLDAIIDAAYLAEPDFSTDLSPQGHANYFRTEDTFTASYKWSSRVSSDSTYLLRVLDTQDNNSSNSGNLLDAGQNRIENTFRESLRYRWSPRTTLTVEYRFGVIDYDDPLRNSSTHTAIGGFDLQVNSRLNATFRGGATYREYEQAAGGARTDPYFSGSLHYHISSSTSLNWTGSYSIEEPNSLESLSRTTLRTGLQLSYALSKHVSTHLTLNYHHDENDGLLVPGSIGTGGSAYTDDALELGLGAKYTLTHRLSLDVGFTHSELDSGGPTIGYSRNRYTTGLTFTY